jgi:hypothetical protein
LNGNARVPPWNNVTIRNQARWGALQAVLIIREYRACYEALVEALESGGNLGDCIYAIEKAAKENGLGPLKDPVGYIVELPGDEERWTTERPDENGFFGSLSKTANSVNPTTTIRNGSPQTMPSATNSKMGPQESLAKLNEYRKSMEDKLKEIDEKLGGLNDQS